MNLRYGIGFVLGSALLLGIVSQRESAALEDPSAPCVIGASPVCSPPPAPPRREPAKPGACLAAARPGIRPVKTTAGFTPLRPAFLHDATRLQRARQFISCECTKPTYLKIYLPATPKNHRSPPR